MKTSFLLITLFIVISSHAQVGIGTTSPESTLDIRAVNHNGTVSSSDGILIPRVNSLSVNGATHGQMVFLTADAGLFSKGFHYWDSLSSLWTPIDTQKEPWYVSGTSNEASLNTQDIYLLGQVGIGTDTPTSDLDVRKNGEANIRLRTSSALSSIQLQRTVDDPNSPSNVVVNTRNLGAIDFGGHIGSGNFFTGGKILTITRDDWSSGASRGTSMEFSTVKTGESSLVRRLAINQHGGVSIGENPTYNSNAVLNLESTDKGFLPPRMTTVQMNSALVANGSMIYNTDEDCLFTYNGSEWISNCSKMLTDVVNPFSSLSSTLISSETPTVTATTATYTSPSITLTQTEVLLISFNALYEEVESANGTDFNDPSITTSNRAKIIRSFLEYSSDGGSTYARLLDDRDMFNTALNVAYAPGNYNLQGHTPISLASGTYQFRIVFSAFSGDTDPDGISYQLTSTIASFFKVTKL